MELKRIDVRAPLRGYFRVPLNGEAILSNSSSNPTIRARTIDISQGGVAIKTSEEVPTAEYQIEILTEAGQRIEMFTKLVRADDSIVGFQTLQIEQKSQEVIRNLFFEYEKTSYFIKQLDRFNLFDHIVVDEKGSDMEIIFEGCFQQ